MSQIRRFEDSMIGFRELIFALARGALQRGVRYIANKSPRGRQIIRQSGRQFRAFGAGPETGSLRSRRSLAETRRPSGAALPCAVGCRRRRLEPAPRPLP
jgi:hypothetical protein